MCILSCVGTAATLRNLLMPPDHLIGIDQDLLSESTERFATKLIDAARPKRQQQQQQHQQQQYQQDHQQQHQHQHQHQASSSSSPRLQPLQGTLNSSDSLSSSALSNSSSSTMTSAHQHNNFGPSPSTGGSIGGSSAVSSHPQKRRHLRHSNFRGHFHHQRNNGNNGNGDGDGYGSKNMTNNNGYGMGAMEYDEYGHGALGRQVVSSHLPRVRPCSICHVPYNHNFAPFARMKVVPCALCGRKWCVRGFSFFFQLPSMLFGSLI